MIYLEWVVLAVLGKLVMLANILFAPIIALFINHATGQLPWCLSWFQTADNPAYGDELYHNNEMAWAKWLSEPLFLYVCGIFWGIRNPAYGYDTWAGVTVKEGFTLIQPEHNLEWIGDELHGIGQYRATVRFAEGTSVRKLLQDGNTYFELWWVRRWGNHFSRIRLGWFLDSTERYPLKVGDRRNLQATISPWLKCKNDFL